MEFYLILLDFVYIPKNVVIISPITNDRIPEIQNMFEFIFIKVSIFLFLFIYFNIELDMGYFIFCNEFTKIE